MLHSSWCLMLSLKVQNYIIFQFFKFITMQTGTVKFFNETKGFGFIVDDANGQEIFVHVSGLNVEIREGDKVSFETQQGRKGINAVNVSVVS
jgi:cold shock protein